ncbi:hypothetical protein AB0O57_29260 [Streptomyces sp. NPDC091201]|uniref:hypothetical protein n=1 Tax=Streptomyces sp. NPDC091201 TaxID=3155190 RepID=UPI00344A8EFB
MTAPLAGRRDFWDRPEGDWGDGRPQEQAHVEFREHANSCYRMGSVALSRGDLAASEKWLGKAMDADHPGAWLRFAVIIHRLGPCRVGEQFQYAHLRFLVQGAADFGHGDAQYLRPLLTDATAVLPPADWEDPDYGPELEAALRAGLDVLPPHHDKE